MTRQISLPHRRMFILGAGFSRPAGLPLAKELLDSVRREVRTRLPDSGKRDRALEQEIREWTELYPCKPVDLESVMAYSHRKHYLQLLGSREPYEHGSVSIVAARRAIQRILIDCTPIDVPALYQNFANHLTPNDLVLTFNYDTLLEQSLDAIGKPYSLTPEWWLERGSSESGYNYVDLLKLHGSIDWYDRKFHDEALEYYDEKGYNVPDCDPIFGPNPTVQVDPLSKGDAGEMGQHILSRVFRVSNHSHYFPLDGKRFSHVVPFVLPLAYDKLLGHDPIVDLWRSLHHNLDAFSTIIVIGYSMPHADSYAYEALGKLFVDYQAGGQRTLWEQRRVPIQIITKAESEADVFKSLPFLNSTSTQVWCNGFSNESLNWLDWGDGDLKA